MRWDHLSQGTTSTEVGMKFATRHQRGNMSLHSLDKQNLVLATQNLKTAQKLLVRQT
jgi:hypothetical protein